MTSILVDHPWIAAVVAGGFWLLWRLRPHKLIATAALVWTAYCAYEYLMRWRILCTGECNIRVDLLLIYPVLGLLSLAAMLSSLNRKPTPA